MEYQILNEKHVVKKNKSLKESGIKFVQNFEVGKDKSLYDKHDIF